MTKIIFVLLLIISVSCREKQENFSPTYNFSEDSTLSPRVVMDIGGVGEERERRIQDSISIISLEYHIRELERTNGGCRNKLDSVTTELTLSRFKEERVRYYLNICLRNPSQDKFLKGWIKRALED